MARGKIFFQESFFNLPIEIGNNAKAAISIRKEPTCSEENMAVPSSANIPFFMRINELPQIQASKRSNNQLIVCLDIF
jgi:hypothetical protein